MADIAFALGYDTSCEYVTYSDLDGGVDEGYALYLYLPPL